MKRVLYLFVIAPLVSLIIYLSHIMVSFHLDYKTLGKKLLTADFCKNIKYTVWIGHVFLNILCIGGGVGGNIYCIFLL